MAYALTEYAGNDTTGPWTVGFPYVSKTHVRVYNDGTEDTTFTWATDTTINTTSAVATGTTVVIVRDTSRSARLTDYQDASTLTEAVLDADSIQAFYMSQEAIDTTDRALSLPFGETQFSAKIATVDRQIKDLADPTDAQDAVTKSYGDANYGGAAAAAAAASAAAASTSESNASASAASALSSKNAASSSEIAAAASAASINTPTIVAGDDGKMLMVNADEDGYAFVDLQSKGSILATDANGRPTRLAPGTDGDVLKADSTASGGVAWLAGVYPRQLEDYIATWIGGGPRIDTAATSNYHVSAMGYGQDRFVTGFRDDQPCWLMGMYGGSTNYAVHIGGPGANKHGWNVSGLDQVNGIAFDQPNNWYCTVGEADGSDAYIGVGQTGSGIIERTNPKSIALNYVVYSPNSDIMVAVGDNDGSDAYIVTSPASGSYATWTERSNPKNYPLTKAVIAPNLGTVGRIVATGWNDGVDAYAVYSDDEGATWTEISGIDHSVQPATIYGLVWDQWNNKFVCCGGFGVVFNSTDGITWTDRASTGTLSAHYGDSSWWGLAATPLGILMIGTSTNSGYMYISKDGGDTWTRWEGMAPQFALNAFGGLEYGGGMIAAWGSSPHANMVGAAYSLAIPTYLW